jgi:hypothetical protein
MLHGSGEVSESKLISWMYKSMACICVRMD